MNIDHDYLKGLLQACQESEHPTFDIKALDAAGFDHNDKQFEFHMKILDDRHLIERDAGDPGFGLLKGIRWLLIVVNSSTAANGFGTRIHSSVVQQRGLDHYQERLQGCELRHARRCRQKASRRLHDQKVEILS